MSRPMQWLSLIGGIIILVYGISKLFAQPPEWIPMILGLLIVAFSVSKILKARTAKEEPESRDGP